MKGIIFNNPLEGKGKVVGNDGAVILINTGTLGDQTFNINEALYIINPRIVPESLRIINPVGSMLVFLGVNSNEWYNADYGTLPGSSPPNFEIYGHRYWLNATCGHASTWTSNWASVIPSDPLYQIGGTYIYVNSFYEWCPTCPWISETLTRTTTITTEDFITQPTTISTVTTTTTNEYAFTVTEIVYDVAVPALSTTYTTTIGSVTTPSTSTTYTTTLTDSNGSSSTEVVVVIVTPPPSTTYTTTVGSVSVTTTSTTYTTTLTDSNGSSSTEVVIVIVTPPPFNSFMTSSMSVSSPIYRNSSIPVEKTATTLTGTLVVLTTVVHGVTITTTYCPESSATSEISMTAIIGHSSIESVYTNSKNQQEETNSFSAISNAISVASTVPITTGSVYTNNENYPTSRNSRASTTVVVESAKGNTHSTSGTGAVIGTVESRKPEASPTTKVPHVSKSISEQLSSSSTAIMVHHEGKGSTMYMKWSVAHFVGLLLFMII